MTPSQSAVFICPPAAHIHQTACRHRCRALSSSACMLMSLVCCCCLLPSCSLSRLSPRCRLPAQESCLSATSALPLCVLHLFARHQKSQSLNALSRSWENQRQFTIMSDDVFFSSSSTQSLEMKARCQSLYTKRTWLHLKFRILIHEHTPEKKETMSDIICCSLYKLPLISCILFLFIAVETLPLFLCQGFFSLFFCGSKKMCLQMSGAAGFLLQEEFMAASWKSKSRHVVVSPEPHFDFVSSFLTAV